MEGRCGRWGWAPRARQGALRNALSPRDGATIAFSGPGAAEYATATAHRHPSVEAVVVGPQSRPSRTVDTYVIAEGVPEMKDDALIAELRRARQWTAGRGHVAMVCDVLRPHEADDHDHWDNVQARVLFGGGIRTKAEILDVLWEAGLALDDVTTVGWGYSLWRCTAVATLATR
ncbi:hypothetical protein [Demequina sp.]|uniref:hypothetical protein n=1 Tax=Demequina sp. TaxID=2050685 RepID=UPI003A8381E4